MTPDLSYSRSGPFTRFYPNTPAGESAWREMAKADGVAAVLRQHEASVISQLRAAGYSVRKEAKETMSIDEILTELGE